MQRTTIVPVVALALLSACNQQGGSNSSGSQTTNPGSTVKPTPTPAPSTSPPTTGRPVPVTQPSPAPAPAPSPTPSPSPSPSPSPVPTTVPKYLYSTNPGDCSIDQFSIDPKTGALTQVNAPVTAGTPTMFAWRLTIDPAKKFLYATDLDMPSALSGGPWTWTSGDVSSWTIDPNTGALTLASTFTGTTGTGLGITPNGKYVVVANPNADTVTVLATSATGALTQASSASGATGASPSALVIDSKGSFVYVMNSGNNTISVYSISAAGGLAAVGTPVAAGVGPSGPCISNDGKTLIVCNTTANTVSTYSISSATGAITAIPSGTLNVSVQPNEAAVHPSGKFVYVVNYDNQAYNGGTTLLDFDPTTGLLSNPTFYSQAGPKGLKLGNGVAIDPTGTFVFSGMFQYIAAFTADAKTGTLAASGYGTATKTLTGSYNEPLMVGHAFGN